MGLFGLFKKQNADTPKLKSGATKTFDYFAFKLKDEKPDVYKSVGFGLHENPKFVKVVPEDETLKVFINNNYAGFGDKTAYKKFQDNCTKKWNVHSAAIHETEKGIYCKIRIKYFY